jgi:malate dehydrogenase (oxaloacetate-decarboxylating)(NADP+)
MSLPLAVGIFSADLQSFVCGVHSLLGTERSAELSNEQRRFVRPQDGGMALIDVIKKYKPTILIGVTAVGGLFTEQIATEMGASCERPIIFPLSNPTTKAECTAEQAYEWTDGRCIFASGSPFDPVELDDGRICYPSQCNNMYIFPGLGLGATVCGAQKITNRMLYLAAEALATFVPEEEVVLGKLFPPLDRIREVSHRIGVAVVKEAIREGLATKVPSGSVNELDSFVASKMYYPEYVPLVPASSIF